MLRNIVTVGVFAVLNVLACIGIWATAVVLGNYLLNSEVTPEYLNALYYEYELLRDSGIDDPRLEMAADIIGSLNSHLEMRIDESNKGEVFYAMCSVQLAYDSMFAGLQYSEVFPYA